MLPFVTAELSAGLRRYLAEPEARVTQVTEYQLAYTSPTAQVRGVRVQYQARGETLALNGILKERPTTGRREIGVYRSLGNLLPVATPALIAVTEGGQWLVFEALEVDPEPWRPEDYRHAVGDPPTDLALHPTSPGYRLILNNILFPAAKKKMQKT